MALRNILQTYENPADALQDLANGKATMEVRINELDQRRQQAGNLTQVEQQEYDQLARRFRGNEQLERSLPGAFQQAHADKISDYQTKDIRELAADVTALASRQQQAEEAVRAARAAHGTNSQEYRDAEARRNRARSFRQEAEQIYNARNQPNVEAVAQLAASQREEQRQQEETRVNAQRQELEEHDIRWLRNEQARLDTQITELTARRANRVAAGASAQELAEIDRDIARAQERNTEADRILGDKLAGATEAIDKDVALQNEKSFVERSTSEDLRTAIEDRTQNVNNLWDQIEAWRAELNDPAAGLNPAQRRDIQNQLYDATERLQREETMLKLNQEALYKSNKEFRGMKPNERAEELAKIGQELDMTDFDRNDINARLLAGENVTKEEMAAWAKLTVAELVEHGRGNLHMDQLNRIFAMRPELRLTVADGIANSEQGRAFLREHFPNNWEKILDFARRHPSWLILLLAILAGAAGAVAVATGPGLGVAAGAAGLGGGAIGVTRPRSYR